MKLYQRYDFYRYLKMSENHYSNNIEKEISKYITLNTELKEQNQALRETIDRLSRSIPHSDQETHSKKETIYFQNKKLKEFDEEIKSKQEILDMLRIRLNIGSALTLKESRLVDVIEEAGSEKFYKITNFIIRDHIDSRENTSIRNKELMEQLIYLCEEYNKIKKK